MNFNEFLSHAKKVNGVPLDTLAKGWIARVRHASVRNSYPMGTDSYDATERHEFADGSAIVVGNPDQITFSLNVYVAED